MTDPDPTDLRARVQARIDAELERQHARLEEIGPTVADLTEPVARLLKGGKRLRASFLYWGWRAAGRPDDGGTDGVISLAAAMELFQAAALIHDDVMDESDTRRGMPAAHRAMATEHVARGWEGDPERFGRAGAILAGNLCLQWCDDLYAGSGLHPDDLARARPVYEVMRTQLMAGQLLDVVESVRPWTGVEHTERVARARHVIRYKSAKYSIEHPLLIGATAGGLGDEARDLLSRYGLSLGEAFQLRDDVLGVFGDPEVTGKPAGDDLREGKRTVLIARALAQSDSSQTRVVESGLGDPTLAGGRVDEIRHVLRDTGALDDVEADIQRLAEDARAAVRDADIDDTATAELLRLVDVTTARAS